MTAPARRTLLPLVPALLIACTDGVSSPATAPLLLGKPSQETGDSQSWSTGHTLQRPLRVQLTRDGVPEAGAAVVWGADPGNGTMTPGTSTTGVDGIAVAYWTLGTVAGDHHAQASVESAEQSPVRFVATAYPNFAYRLAVVSGDGQQGPTGQELDGALVVRVGDQFDNAFEGAEVRWAVVQGSATLGATMTRSTASGTSAITVTLEGPPGIVQVSASVAGAAIGSPATFQLETLP